MGSLLFSDIVYAQIPFTQNDLDRVRKNEYYRDPEEPVIQSATCSSDIPPTTAYLIGDSITVSVKSQINAEFESLGIALTVNAVVSRSLTTGDAETNGLSALSNDAGIIAQNDVAIIALGTNGGISPANITTAINEIRSASTRVKIYWVNVGVNNDKRDGDPIADDSINGTIESESDNGKIYTVVDWKSVVKENPEIIADDGLGVHLTTEGFSNFSSAIGSSVSGNPEGGCSTLLTGTDNPEKVWNYMISKGLQPFQAAGFMGNMQAESGFEPRRTEYAFSEKPNLSDDVPLPPNCANSEANASPDNLGLNCFPGYGLVQWTTTGRKQGLRDLAALSGKSEGDLGVQMDYVWQEINQRILNKSSTVDLYGRVSTIDALLQTTSVEAATFLIAKEYEIPGDFEGTLPVRTGFARSWLQKFGSGGV
jgi:hypothetical protein